MRGDITWPGAPDGLVPAGASDTTWLPIVGCAGLVVLTRDKRIRSRPLERQALPGHGVRACFLTSGGSLDLFDQLRLWLRNWDDIEELVATNPGPGSPASPAPVRASSATCHAHPRGRTGPTRVVDPDPISPSVNAPLLIRS
ncbi:MAG: hypothetical protein AB7I38_19310 [Dehalococcoidia bacterium]